MKLFNKINWLPTSLALVSILIIFGLNAPKAVHAAQKSGKDTTVSTSDIQFTDIPTAADSIAIRKKAADSAAKANAAKPAANQKAPDTEKPKTLWQIFIFDCWAGLPRLYYHVYIRYCH